MQAIKLLASAVVLVAATAVSATADVTVAIANGRVTVVAKDATLRQILSEWARVGQTKIVNLERVSGGPITIELMNVPEEQALDILLRPVSGFMAAPRVTQTGALSRYDRIVVMPTLAQPRPPLTAAAAPPPGPTFTPQPQPPPFSADDEAEATGQAQRAPVFNTFPQPQVVYPGTTPQPVNPQLGPNGQPLNGQQPVVQQPAASPYASPFGGVAVPGMIVTPPQQQPGQPGVVQPMPGQVGQPGVVQPGQPRQPAQQPTVRRPGGQ
jgi:hypothetical protein